MARQITGIDIGSYSIKVAQLHVRGKNQNEWLCQTDEQLIVLDHSSNDPELRKKAELEALEALKLRGRLSGEIYISALPSAQAQMKFLEVPFTQDRKISAVLGGILESQLPLNIESIVYPWTRMSGVISAPAVGHSIVAGFAPKIAISEHLALLENYSISPTLLNFKALALFELGSARVPTIAAASEDKTPSNLCSAIVDIGHKSTSICISSGSGVLLARVVLRGMTDIFATVARKLNIEAAKVQELLQQGHGLATISDQSTNDEIAWRNALAEALSSIAADIRQSLQALKIQGNYRIESCYIIGGGSKIAKLAAYLTKFLQIPVFLGSNLPLQNLGLKKDLSSGLAISLALQGLSLSEKNNRLNFRFGEFAFRGQQSLLKGRIGALIGWGLALTGLIVMYFAVQNIVLKQQTAAIVAEQQKLCDPIKKGKVISSKKCLTTMREQLASSRKGTVSNFSAADAYVEIARVLPSDITVKITDLDISQGSLRIQGSTKSFEAVEKIVIALSRGRCFTDVQKGKATMQDNEVLFAVSLTLKCNTSAKAGGTA